MRFAFTIWFRVFFLLHCIYLAPFSSNKPSLNVAVDHQSFGINIYFFYVWKLARINRHLFLPWILFPFRKQGSVFAHCLRFCSLFTKGYTCICIFLQWHQQTTQKLLNVYINCQIRPSKRGCCQSSFQISKRNLASSKLSGVTCQENLYKITTKNLIWSCLREVFT